MEVAVVRCNGLRKAVQTHRAQDGGTSISDVFLMANGAEAMIHPAAARDEEPVRTKHNRLVSVGIPFHNNVETIDIAIRSVFAQTYENWELILVDDGATDGSLPIARSVKDSRVRVISDGANKGLACRLNQIAGLANGDYIARMDADDIMHPERLASQVEYLQANPCVDVVGSAVYTIDENDAPTGVRSLRPLDFSLWAALRHGLFVHPSVCGRAEWFRHNPYDDAFLGSEDRELWVRTLKTSSFAKLPRPLLFYRENDRAVRQYLKHYLKAGRYERRICRTYGPACVGWSQTAGLLTVSYLKCATYAIAAALGVQGRLVGKRNRALSEIEKAAAVLALNIVAGASVPGLESSKEIGASEWK